MVVFPELEVPLRNIIVPDIFLNKSGSVLAPTFIKSEVIS
jgi:hypothetical protein